VKNKTIVLLAMAIFFVLIIFGCINIDENDAALLSLPHSENNGVFVDDLPIMSEEELSINTPKEGIIKPNVEEMTEKIDELLEVCKYPEKNFGIEVPLDVSGTYHRYEYDENGNMIKFIMYDNNTGSGWNENSRLYWDEYENDRNGNWIKKNRYNADGTIRYWAEYEWYENTNTFKEIVYNPDGSTNHWKILEYSGRSDSNQYFRRIVKEICYRADDSMIYWHEYGSSTMTCYRENGTIKYVREIIFEVVRTITKTTFYNEDGSKADVQTYIDFHGYP